MKENPKNTKRNRNKTKDILFPSNTEMNISPNVDE